MFNRHRIKVVAGAAFALLVLLWPSTAAAHCDGLDGPVVNAARTALDTGKVESILVWVLERDEAAVRDAFRRTLAVRAGGAEAKALADTWFFETVVRLHRAGEGEPYTGLKPAGRDLGPAIPAADNALETGSADRLLALLTEAMRATIGTTFEEALHARKARGASIEKGRDYVRAYVGFLHAVDRIDQATRAASDAHSAGTAEPPR